MDAAGNEVLGKQLDLERKDVWDVCWSKDNPTLLALMEKTRMYIIRDSEPEVCRRECRICNKQNIEYVISSNNYALSLSENQLLENFLSNL